MSVAHRWPLLCLWVILAPMLTWADESVPMSSLPNFTEDTGSINNGSLSTRPALNSKEIIIAAEDNWPPFSDEKGKGLSAAIVSAAYALTGYRIRTMPVPYARALYYTERNKTHACWNVTKQQSTEAKYLFHQIPLFKASSSFYYTQQAKPYKSLLDIPDQAVVGVILGYEYGDLFETEKRRFQLIEVSSHEQLLALLHDDKLDVAIFFDDVLQYYLQRLKRTDLHIIRGELNYISEIFVAFNKQDPLSPQRAAALDQGLRLLHETGDYQRMLEQFGISSTTK